MRRMISTGVVTAAVLVAAVLLVTAFAQDKLFGDKPDVEFAKKAWTAMKGYQDWPMKSGIYPGRSPHGKFLRIYYNMVDVNGKPYHVIVKDNYGGEGATMEAVKADPDKFLLSVTPMIQREAGYDPENNNWFWAKYRPDGTLFTNPQGTALAGRVAKGAGQGCIACHKQAKGDDYIFSNDKWQ